MTKVPHLNLRYNEAVDMLAWGRAINQLAAAVTELQLAQSPLLSDLLALIVEKDPHDQHSAIIDAKVQDGVIAVTRIYEAGGSWTSYYTVVRCTQAGDPVED
jgi:hypothetical protein